MPKSSSSPPPEPAAPSPEALPTTLHLFDAHGIEDAVLGDELYDRVMKVFKARVDAEKQFKPAP